MELRHIQDTTRCGCCLTHMPCSYPKNPSFIVPCFNKKLPLPQKVMVKIFEYYIDMGLNSYEYRLNPFKDLCTLGRVCETWRQLIVRTESLWKGIELVLKPVRYSVSSIKGPVDRHNGIYFDYDAMKLLHKRGHVKIMDPEEYLKFVDDFELTMRHTYSIIVIRKFDWMRNVLARYGLRMRTLILKLAEPCRIYSHKSNHYSSITALDLTIYCHRTWLKIRPDDFVKLVPNLTHLVLSNWPEFIWPSSEETNKIETMPENYGFRKLKCLTLDGITSDECWSVAMLIGCSHKLRKLTLRGAKAIEGISLNQFWRNKKVEKITVIHEDDPYIGYRDPIDAHYHVKLSPLVKICRQELKIFRYKFIPIKSIHRDRIKHPKYEIAKYKEERMRVLNSLYQEGRNASLQQIHYDMIGMEPDEASLVSSLRELCRQNCDKIEQS